MNTEGVEIKAGKIIFWSGKYHMDMNSRDTLATDLNVLTEFNPKLSKAYSNSDFVMLGNIDPAIQISIIKQLKNNPN